MPLVVAFLFFFNYGLDALLVLAVGEGASLSTDPLYRLGAFPSLELHRLESGHAHLCYHLLELLCLLELCHVVIRFGQGLRLGFL